MSQEVPCLSIRVFKYFAEPKLICGPNWVQGGYRVADRTTVFYERAFLILRLGPVPRPPYAR